MRDKSSFYLTPFNYSQQLARLRHTRQSMQPSVANNVATTSPVVPPAVADVEEQENDGAFTSEEVYLMH